MYDLYIELKDSEPIDIFVFDYMIIVRARSAEYQLEQEALRDFIYKLDGGGAKF